MKKEYFEIWFKLTFAILILIAFIISFSRCTTVRTVSTHTRDTMYVSVKDTAVTVNKDSLLPQKQYLKIDTVFQEIEKDCPNEKNKIVVYKKDIKNVCTIESLTGGSMSIYFPHLKQNISVSFLGNKGIASEKGYEKVITDKTETIKTIEPSFFGKIMRDIKMIGFCLLLIIIAFGAGWFAGKI